MEKKIKHLEFAQDVINRMAKNSFLIKGWSITAMAALFAAANKTLDTKYMVIAIFVVLVFWLLDSYYLLQERLFIALYNNIREQKEEDIDFSMHTTKFCGGERTWPSAFFSHTCLLFYLSLLAVMAILVSLIK